MKLDLSGFFPGSPRAAEQKGKGTPKRYTAELGMDTLDLGRVRYPIADKEPVDLYVSRSGQSSVHIEGDVSLTLAVPCDRCLDETRQVISFRLDREIDFGAEDGEEDMSFVEGHTIDVDGLVFPEIVLRLPMKALCSADCKGICKVCGTNLNRESCACDPFVPDPRMSAINDIFHNSVNQ